MSEGSVFVLLAIDTTPDQAPNEIWVFSRQAEAERFLKAWSRDFLGGYTHDSNKLPPDAELVEAFRKAGTQIHLYECHLSGDSVEVVPFERESEAA
jgi:hypothetical protein